MQSKKYPIQFDVTHVCRDQSIVKEAMLCLFVVLLIEKPINHRMLPLNICYVGVNRPFQRGPLNAQ